MFWRQLVLFGLVMLLSMAKSGIRYVSHKNCNNLEKGTIIANPGNCSQYIMCNGLRSTLGECSKGFYFNAKMLSCNTNPLSCWLLQATTTSITQENITTTSTPLLSTEYPPIVHRPVCSSQQDHYYPHPYNCSYYYQCVRGLLTVRKCYFGFGWDWLRQTCIPISMAFCAGQ